MSGDLISDLLDKLSKKTGREWTLADIMRLAEKLPEDGSRDIDKVLNELADMGLEVPEDTKQKVKQKVEDGQPLSLDDLDSIQPKQVKGSGSRKSVKASGPKKKQPSLWEQLRQLSGRKRKKR
ncbi:hypothetical protein [Brevibacillus sp. H7]|uniref:hypothetical protein n=1 Tax=Brevibacillus sp. H7 TaxID=3349138 RepID=UPI0037F9AFB5